MSAPIQGLFFRNFKNAYFPEILKEIYRDRIYDPYLYGKKGLVMMDIGANVGLWTFYAYEYASKIYSIEPAQEHYQCLKTMIEFNEMKDKVTTIRRAVGHVDKTEKFYHTENSTMFSMNPGMNPNGYEEVVVSTLPTLFKDFNIDHVDFIKLDVEGSEMEIIGGKAFDEVAKKIDIIMGEWHIWTNTNPHQLEAAFIDRGFRFEWLRNTEASIFIAKRI